MRCTVKWTSRDRSPGNGVLTMSEVDLPPSADRVIPVIVRGDSVVTANELAGAELTPLSPISPELRRAALDAGFRFN